MLRRWLGIDHEIEELRAEMLEQAREVRRLRERVRDLETHRETLRLVQGCDA